MVEMDDPDGRRDFQEREKLQDEAEIVSVGRTKFPMSTIK